MSGSLRDTASGAAPHDWSRYTLAQIWAMLEPQSRGSGVVAAGAWSRMHTLCAQEADAIEGALSRLAERWPLTQPAAVAFQEWGAHFVKSMRGTAETAAQNRGVVDSITYEIDNVRKQVAALRDEAEEYHRIETGFSKHAADMLFHTRHVGGTPPLGILVPWEGGLTVVAQRMMQNLETVIDQHYGLIVQDELYEPADGYIESAPVPWVEPSGAAGSGDQGLRTLSLTSPGRHDNTLLDGVVTSSPSPVGAAAGGPTLWDNGSSTSFVDTPSGRVLAPGGVIGAPALSTPSRPLSVPPAPRPVGSGGPGMMPMIPPTMASTVGSPVGPAPHERRARRGLPGVFDVPEGPPAVIRPPQEPQAHEPGPGVFGIDR